MKNNFFFSLLFVAVIGYSKSQAPVVLGYFPSWTESWTSPGANSLLREIPSYVNHVFLSFAKPNMTYVQGSYDISDTGIQVPYDGCTLKESVNVLNEKGIKVILSVGGETYWGTPNAYNINYQQIKDLVDDMGFAGIDWDYEPNGSFADIGSSTNVQHFIDFITYSRALMPASSGYIIACAPSGVGALGGQLNDDPSSPYAYANRNTLTGESDANLYNASAPTNGINLFGYSATGHMIPVFTAVGADIDLVALQGYNVGGSNNREIMYDSYAHYAEMYGFKVAAGVHYPDEPWGPYYNYTHTNVASLSAHIRDYPPRVGDGDGIMIWQLLLSGSSSSAYSYMNVASNVLNGDTEINAVNNATNLSMEPYSGGAEVNCFCTAPEPDLGSDQSLCGVSSISLNSNISLQSGVSFTWLIDGTTVVSNSPSQNTYLATVPGTYTVQVEEGGCYNEDGIVITNSVANVDLGIDQNICPQGSVTLSTGLSEPSYSYSWTLDGSVISGATSSSYTVSQIGTYEVSVSASGCSSVSDNTLVYGELPPFDLGSPIDLCSPVTATLNTGLNHPNYSFVWSLDGNSIPGADQSSYTATMPGTYEVSVSAPSCTSGSENILITSSLPIGTNDTICAPGTADLVADQNVEWYDAPASGNLLATGSSFSPSISSTTDFWIAAGSSVQQFTTMRSAFQGGGWQQFPYVYGTKLIVSQTLTLTSVGVDAGGGNATINVVENDGTTLVASTTVSNISGLTAIPLNFTLAPGTYYLNTLNSSSNFYVDLTPASNYENPGVLTVEGEAYWDWGSPSGANYVPSGDYGNFINLEYTVGTTCDRVPVTAVLDPSNPSCGGCTPTSSFTTASSCELYTWSANNTTYTASGIYTDTLINADGCDSLVTLELSILDPSSGSETVVSCDSYTWTADNMSYSTSGIYSTTLTNAAGCDSIATLDLTIEHSTSASITENGFDSVVVNGQVYTSSGTYTQVLTGTNGCDSILTITVFLDFTGLDTKETKNIVIHPNPGTNWIKITGLDEENLLSLRILDIQGKHIKTIRPDAEEIEIGTIEKGNYILEIKTERNIYRERFVKH